MWRRDWQLMQAVRARGHEAMGIIDHAGPFPDQLVEIHLGTALARVGAVMSYKKDCTPIILEAVAAMENHSSAHGQFSFEPDLARLDFANHKEDCLLGTRASVETMADALDELAQTLRNVFF